MALAMRVSVPLTDLRRTKTFPANVYGKDSDQETQLLFNERFIVLRQEGDWSWGEAVEQQKFYPEEGWRGYRGWIHSRDLTACECSQESNFVVIAPWTTLSLEDGTQLPLSFGTSLTITAEVEVLLPNGVKAKLPAGDLVEYAETDKEHKCCPTLALAHARKFNGYPYHWGGCSAYLPEAGILTSVDCSGLVHLAYRAVGVNLPRDARDQHKVVRSVDFAELEEGDLLFVAPADRPEAIDHVMLYSGNGNVLEAAMSHGKVREGSFHEKYAHGDFKVYPAKVYTESDSKFSLHK